MDEHSKIIEDFEAALKNQNVRKPIALYSGSKNQNFHNSKSKSTCKKYTAQDILANVSRQMKAIQNADCVRSDKRSSENLNMYKMSCFLPVNMLSRHVQVPNQKMDTNKFETQCVSDTQLIDILQDVEAQDIQKGMTQEFNTCFCNTHIDNNEIANKDRDNKDKDKEDKDIDNKIDEQHQNELDYNEESDQIQTEPEITNHSIDHDILLKETCATSEYVDIPVDKVGKYNKVIEKHEYSTVNAPQMLNECSEIGDANQLDLRSDINMRLSPVFSIKPTVDNSIPSQVFDLEPFEKFKTIAVEVVEHNVDFETAKLMINSQIIGKELSIQADAEPVLNQIDEQINHEDIFTPEVDEEHQNEIDYNEDSNYIQTESGFTMIDISLKESNLNIGYVDIPTGKASENDKVIEKDATENVSQTLNDCIEIGDANELDLGSDINKPLSLIFSDKPTVDDFIPSPLVFDLESFEKFETIAVKVVEQNVDLETAKFLINSQIFRKELSIQADAEPVCNQIHEQIGPVEDNTLEIKKIVPENKNAADTQDSSDKFLDDEILFSSDEEEYIHKDIVDLPLTCALETSYYTKSAVLDKIMYVGFQTASNKSIQIGTDSFCRAKTVLDDIDKCMGAKEPSLTELVEICDKNIFNQNCLTDIIDTERSIANKQDIKALIPETKKIHEKYQDNENTCDISGPNGKSIQKSEHTMLRSIATFSCDANSVIKRNEEHVEMSKEPTIDEEILQEFENKEFTDVKDNREPEFMRFKTASLKNIKISANALAKSKKIFQDIDFAVIGHEMSKACHEPALIDDILPSEATNFDDQNITSNIGFRTASNKEIKISDQALIKTKTIFHDIENIDGEKRRVTDDRNREHLETENLIQDDIFNQPSTSKGFIGFKTANNKEITISADALSKTKNIFLDIKEQKCSLENIKRNETQFEGFKTASNKRVEISAAALTKSRKIFQDVENIPTKNIEPSPSFAGFKSANRGDKILKQAFINTENMFEDIDVTNAFDNNLSDPVKDLEGCQGFQTASKNPVKTAQALAESKTIFQDIDKEKSNKERTEYEDMLPKFKGFQTASNKEVKISKQALEKSRKLFQHINEEISSNDIVESKVTDSKFRGFQTASNKTVKISNEALEKSRKIFEGLDSYNKSETAIEKGAFRGFQTANNEEVKVSDEALAKSRKILEDIDNYPKIGNDKVPNTATSFKGFQTASNKPVNISEEAIAISKQLFHNLDVNNENSLQSELKTAKTKTEVANNVDTVDDAQLMNAETMVFAFKTGNNDNIGVTKEALDKSRKLFNYLDNDRRETPSKNNLKITENVFEHEMGPKEVINIENIIDTQVLNDFEESLHTEHFCKEKTPVKSKRSGSPIISCPKAKKRKRFEIPYSQVVKDLKEHKDKEDSNQNSCQKPVNAFAFDQNYKKIKKYSLQDLERIEKQTNSNKTNIDPYLLKFTFENLLNFEFIRPRNDIKDERWTMNDLKKCFLDSVNVKLIPEGWVDNHLKLILWKLISYEIKFPNAIGLICTAKNILEQMKYRFDRELYNTERSALRKILEKDDISTRTMVLCVVAIYEDGVSVCVPKSATNIEFLLTDGWYCIKASIDTMVAELVMAGKIVVGSKLATSGAEMVNCVQGVAPWEDTSSIRLKIFGNSTRRARWHSRLGYHGNAVTSAVRTVSPDGGKVMRLRAFVARVYPALYVEKFTDGSTVTRSERLENIHQMQHETERQAMLEKLYEEVEKEFSDTDSQDTDGETCVKRRCLETGSQIAEVMKSSRDPAEFRSHLTDSQKTLLQDHSSKQREKLIQTIEKRVQDKIERDGLNVNRNVIVLLKIRVAGVEERGGRLEVTRAMISIWKPNDAVLEIIKEGSWIEVMNIVPTAIRYSEIQLSAGRMSIFSQSKYKENDKITRYTSALKRTCYTIKDLTKNPGMTTDYNEIDTVGLIFQIDPSIKEFDSTKHQFQNVFLTDADKNMVSVNFWGGLKKFGFENVLDTGQIVVCTNLQKRAGNTRKNIPQFRVTEFTYFTKTPRNEIARNLTEELEAKLSCIDRTRFCDDCIKLKNNYFAVKLQGNTENVSPYRFSNIDVNSTRNRVFIDSPLTKKVEDDLNLTGLDFDSSFKHTETQEMSPKTLLRKRQVKEKIAKLKMYGEPPPLSHIQILNRSKHAGNAYKSPLISKSESSVASEKKILLNEQDNTEKRNKRKYSDIDDNQCSPIMNRTYVKRDVNPVKLNFSHTEESNLSDVVDHFAEDFDGSPPLSLD